MTENEKTKNTPALRFKGFTDDWEQRKLSSLFARFDDGDWIEAKDQSSLGVRLVQTGNVGVTEFIDKADNKKWISEETFNRLNCEEIFPGDILISRLPEPAGRACIVPETGTRMITAVDCTIARTSAENSAAFIVQCLSTPGYFKWVNTCLAGGTRQRISRSMLGAYDVMVPPTIGEQKQIGAYFQRLDHLITLHQRQHGAGLYN
ncbi:restriction endonuclease subunit S [Galactobacillus timonensis]|uniref:restriction endonuclease subunit S n=1 Tax=Galactobacillus timonensis TaxID=2041840 RepID=UPI001AEC2C5B|nr:restriction endonuclease subunit S [Galactobacillus timonensis]